MPDNGFDPNDFDDPDDDEGYAICLDENGPSLWDGRRFNRISTRRMREVLLEKEGKRFPKPNSLGLTTLTVKEHEMVMKNRDKKNPFLNKFYVGASHIGAAFARGVNDPHTHPTLNAAIENATERINDGNEDTVIIVKIVAVVRRAKAPVTVEKL